MVLCDRQGVSMWHVSAVHGWFHILKKYIFLFLTPNLSYPVVDGNNFATIAYAYDYYDNLRTSIATKMFAL